MRRPLHVAYHQRYLDWQLGKGHPSNPIRATIAVTLLEKLVPDHRRVDHLVSKSIRFFARTALERVHTRDYIEQVVRGDLNGEANRIDPELGLAALTMFAGTQALVYELANADWAPSVSFNPQGARARERCLELPTSGRRWRRCAAGWRGRRAASLRR